VRNDDRPRILAPPPLLFFGCLLLAWGLGRVVPAPLSFLEVGVRFGLGSLFCFVGLVFAMSALIALHRGGTPAEPWKATLRIVTGGPFRFSRNPIYVALLCVLTGVAFFTASLWIALSIALLFLLLDRGVVRAEERYLTGKFGEEYLAYTRSVRRWL
jgi:protein-S-isoprenylcysteine O-methyltransferase Ste14